ncbi:MAG: hypothetical protein OXI51_09300 [Chloroflexota bacterium]|nr:hypothetical protein [Chloroflexota bacterium]
MTLSDRFLRVTRTSSTRKSRAIGLALILAALALAASVACGGGEDEPPPAQEPLSEEDAELAAYLSERTMELWEVYNTYVLDDLRQFYAASYWTTERQDLERNMAPFKDRGTVFVAEETSAPREIEPGKWEVKHTARFGGSSVKMKFIYEQFDGEWLLTYAEVD